MSLRDEIREAQIKAAKERNAQKTSVLRMLWSAIRNEEIDVQHDLTDSEVQGVVARQVKQLQDAHVDFEKGNRPDLLEQSKAEVALLQVYLPKQLSEDELKSIVDEVLERVGKDPSRVGQLIGLIMKEVKGKADGNRVRTMVESALKT